MDIFEIEIFGDDIKIEYTDGSREEIELGIYERKDTEGDTVEQRTATQADRNRLGALAQTFEDDVRPTGTPTAIELYPDGIELNYADGSEESIRGGFYEIKDTSGDTVFERESTATDQARFDAIIETSPSTPIGICTSGDDSISGSVGDDSVSGGGGDDDISGRDGDDSINGGWGDDDLHGGSGSDVVLGGGGHDEIRGGGDGDDLRGGNGNDLLLGGSGDDKLRGDSGDDDLRGNGGDDELRGGGGNDTVNGGGGDDLVKGDSGNDLVLGGGGRDDVRGGSGNDVVDGGDGDDRVIGNTGDDVLDGGSGRDRYNGGLGADTFVFTVDGAHDKINDFEDGIDLIDVSAFGVTDIDAIIAAGTQRNDNLVLDFGGGDTMQIDDVTRAELSAADFIL